MTKFHQPKWNNLKFRRSWKIVRRSVSEITESQVYIAFQRRPPLAPLSDENETNQEDGDANSDEMVEYLNEKLSERLSELAAQTVED